MCGNINSSNVVNHVPYDKNDIRTAITDSGCTSHYMCEAYHCDNIAPTGQNALTVTVPNGQSIKSSHTATLKWDHLPIKARKCHIFPHLKNKILLSIGQFCDAGMTATFTEEILYIYKDNYIVLQGERSTISGMWYIDLTKYHPQKIEKAQRAILLKNVHT